MLLCNFFMGRIVLLFLTMLLAGLQCLRAQKPLLRHYSTSDGLASNTIYSTFQDSRGFMWFCTDLGVSCFDGHQFRNFTSKDGLPDNEIFNFSEDRFHRCWMVCYNHKVCYILNNTVYSAANDLLCRQLDSTHIDYTHMFFNKDGNFCLSGRHIYVIHRDHIALYYPALTFGVVCYYFQENGDEYMIDSRNITKLVSGRKIGVAEGDFRSFAYIDSHAWVFGYDRQRRRSCYDYTINGTQVTGKKIPVPFYVYDFLKHDDSTIWWCTEKGLLSYKPSSGLIDTSNILLPGKAINRAFKDSEGNLWFITINDGIYMQSATKPVIYNKDGGLISDNVLALAVDSSGTLVAAYDNDAVTVIKSRARPRFSLYRSGTGVGTRYTYFLNPHEVILGNNSGVYGLNIDNGRLHKTMKDVAQKSASMHNSFCLLGYYAGASYYNKENGLLSTLWDSTTTAITQDRQGTIWLGTLNGLYSLRGNNAQHFELYKPLGYNRITALAASGNLLAIGTDKNGIFLLSGSNLLHVDESNGLGSNICRRLLVGSDGAVWACTNTGLDKVTVSASATFCIYHYSQSDGLPPGRVNDVAFRGGKAYIATPGGIVVLDEQPTIINALPRAYIVSVSTNDTLYNYPESIALNYKNNSLQINYTGISFAGGSDLTYRYLLQGAGPDTIYTPLRSLSLSSLKPGDYRLLVWAAVKNGYWSRQPAVFTFTVSPPFWQRAWFITWVLLFGASMVWLIFQYRIGRIKASEMQKTVFQKSLAELEMQSMRAQINPHFMFNALNAIQSFYSHHDERAANRYLVSFANLIRKTLTLAKEHWLPLSEELAMLKAYIELEQMRFSNAFGFELILADGVDPTTTKIPAMLFQPYVENAINHGLHYLDDGSGMLIINCKFQDSSLICRIEDNGIGINESARRDRRPASHQSMGMSITRRRVETINKLYSTAIIVTITDKQALTPQSRGTIVEIIIPLNT